MGWFVRLFAGALGVVALGLVLVKLSLGGGVPYPDVSTAPSVAPERVSAPISLPFPPGMVAATPDGRLFFTYHMLHKPERFAEATLFEWVEGEARPWPSLAVQDAFHGAMGITADGQGRLWMVIPGALEMKATRLLALDRETGAIVLDHAFETGVGGFAQDLRVSPDGATVYLADTGLLRFTAPSLLVFDVESRETLVRLKGHASVSPQDWVIRKPDGSPHKLAFGLLTFSVGVDGIALTPDGDWLYYATMSHDSLYRIPTKALSDPSLDDGALANLIERVGKKPLSDGIELLPDNTVVIADIENGGVAALAPDGSLTTLTKDDAVDFADSVTVTPKGDIWYTDSRLTALLDPFGGAPDEAALAAAAPFTIYRITAD